MRYLLLAITLLSVSCSRFKYTPIEDPNGSEPQLGQKISVYLAEPSTLETEFHNEKYGSMVVKGDWEVYQGIADSILSQEIKMRYPMANSSPATGEYLKILASNNLLGNQKDSTWLLFNTAALENSESDIVILTTKPSIEPVLEINSSCNSKGGSCIERGRELVPYLDFGYGVYVVKEKKWHRAVLEKIRLPFSDDKEDLPELEAFIRHYIRNSVLKSLPESKDGLIVKESNYQDSINLRYQDLISGHYLRINQGFAFPIDIETEEQPVGVFLGMDYRHFWGYNGLEVAGKWGGLNFQRPESSGAWTTYYQFDLGGVRKLTSLHSSPTGFPGLALNLAGGFSYMNSGSWRTTDPSYDTEARVAATGPYLGLGVEFLMASSHAGIDAIFRQMTTDFTEESTYTQMEIKLVWSGFKL